MTPEIVFEDDVVIVINKPSGLPSVSLSKKIDEPSLAAWLIEYAPECEAASEKPTDGGLCHRLDTDTSGLIVAAKNREAFLDLRKQFKDRTVTKRYNCLVERRLKGKSHEKSYFYNRHKGSKKISITKREEHAPKNAQFGELIWNAEQYNEEKDQTKITVELITGVRHQIRAELASLGHPLVGDAMYGSTKKLSASQKEFYLVARHIEFDHPETGKRLSFSIPH